MRWFHWRPRQQPDSSPAVTPLPTQQLSDQISWHHFEPKHLEQIVQAYPFVRSLLRPGNEDDMALIDSCFGRHCFIEIWPSLPAICPHCDPRHWENSPDRADKRSRAYIILDETEIVPVQYMQRLVDKARLLSPEQQDRVTQLVLVTILLTERWLEVSVYRTNGQLRDWLQQVQ